MQNHYHHSFSYYWHPIKVTISFLWSAHFRSKNLPSVFIKSNFRKFQMVKLEFAMYHQKLKKHLHCMVARREGWREGTVREFGMDRYTFLYFKWITNKNLLYSTGNSAQCYVAAWVKEKFIGKWIHIYLWPSPFVIHLRLLQNCSLAILQYKIKSLIKKII